MSFNQVIKNKRDCKDQLPGKRIRYFAGQRYFRVLTAEYLYSEFETLANDCYCCATKRNKKP